MASAANNGFVVNKDFVISETIDNETIIINLNSGSYYSLKDAGPVIWDALQNPVSSLSIAAALAQQFDVDPASARAEVEKLLSRLVEEGLIGPAELSGQDGAALGAKEATLRPFEAPSLDKFTDMEAMLLLDPIHDVDEAGWPQLPKPPGTRPDAE